ncbi:uncharacterized protein CELE_C53D6.10 [Caenorhabditis elegans]|uniref:Uncharacterized protein n=1 Tax=Caenorhabditis elegans TaxID=6239 RepID=Q6BEU2_CAEEL|nr:Uncharacterized protein CELE_C53D6.10 [Caenorhabditis elegans]CAH04652.1 Uncharacterized protein CELE_C53D6.10 [Caenorhabditis elegans]|eukprot:NP_001023094.1 Uncharacterized protein CELE_C53D6.10 [Caenorhabditis elegans]
MADNQYEDLVPPGGPTPEKAAIPAFPESNAPSQPEINIPQFPNAQGTGAPPPPTPLANPTEDNKKAVSVKDSSKVDSKIVKATGDGKKKKNGKSSETKTKNKVKKNKSKASADESQMGSAEERLSTNRPSTLDYCQVAILITLLVIICLVSIPVLLISRGMFDMANIKESLEKEE